MNNYLFITDTTSSWGSQSTNYQTPTSSLGPYNSMYPSSVPTVTNESMSQFSSYGAQPNHCTAWSRHTSTGKPLDVSLPWSDNYR